MHLLLILAILSFHGQPVEPVEAEKDICGMAVGEIAYTMEKAVVKLDGQAPEIRTDYPAAVKPHGQFTLRIERSRNKEFIVNGIAYKQSTAFKCPE